MTQQEIDAMSEALRSQGLTWGQTNFAVSLVRNAIAAERHRCARLCEAELPSDQFAPVSQQTAGQHQMAAYLASAIREPNVAVERRP